MRANSYAKRLTGRIPGHLPVLRPAPSPFQRWGIQPVSSLTAGLETTSLHRAGLGEGGEIVDGGTASASAQRTPSYALAMSPSPPVARGETSSAHKLAGVPRPGADELLSIALAAIALGKGVLEAGAETRLSDATRDFVAIPEKVSQRRTSEKNAPQPDRESDVASVMPRVPSAAKDLTAMLPISEPGPSVANRRVSVPTGPVATARLEPTQDPGFGLDPRAGQPQILPAPRAQSQQVEQTGGVHIGSIEVCIAEAPIAPRVQPRAAGPAPLPAQPLARGFTTSVGLRQG
jgi:hypothetical protein